MKPFIFHISLFIWMISVNSVCSQILINELCASNDNVILDELGNSSDWLELYNPSEETINLEDWSLSDDSDNPRKWIFPNINIGPESYLLIFASDEDFFLEYAHTNFKLSADGENLILSNPEGEIVDQINFPELETDWSYGRFPNGGADWQAFLQPTPLRNNEESPAIDLTPVPQLLTTQRFFENTATILLDCELFDCRVFFTRDGSLPNEQSEEYSDGIVIDTTTSIRAIAISEGHLPSRVATFSFFIKTEHQLPVMALTTEPDYFWDWEKGILEIGPNAEEAFPFWGANFWQNWEVPVFMEYFTEDKTLGFSHQMDTRVHGGRGARTNPQKPMRLLVKERYGSNTIEYPFFKNRERTTYKRLVLRNASGDYNNAHIRDAFLARYFIDEELDVDVLAYQPIVLYLNGRYWGIINLREKSDEYYLAHNFGVDIDKVDLLEEDSIVQVGDFEAFNEMYEFVVSHDLSIQSVFDTVATFFDTKNIAETFILQTGLNNNDWLHNNIKYWREKKEAGRWRYLLFDMDIALGRHGWTRYDQDLFTDKMTRYQDTNRHVNVFKRLLENKPYREYFLNRYADLFNTSFRSEIFQREVDRTVGMIDIDMKGHLQRWPTRTYEDWIETRIPIIEEHIEKRPTFARQYLIDYFGLEKEVLLKLNTFPEGAGSIKINTITPDKLPWDGYYFDGVPVTLTIVPNEGFTFSHWQSLHTVLEKDENTTIKYNFSDDDEIVAYFVQEGAELFIQKLYLPENGLLGVELSVPQPTEMSFQLFDVQGRLLRQYPTRLVNGGQQQLFLDLPELGNGMYFLRVKSGVGEDSRKFIRVQ